MGISATTRIGQEMLCLLHAGLFVNEWRMAQEGLLTYQVYKIQEIIYQVGGLEKEYFQDEEFFQKKSKPKL